VLATVVLWYTAATSSTKVHSTPLSTTIDPETHSTRTRPIFRHVSNLLYDVTGGVLVGMGRFVEMCTGIIVVSISMCSLTGGVTCYVVVNVNPENEIV